MQRLAGPFIPLSWCGKGFHLWMWSLRGTQQPFSCVFGNFRHGDTWTNERPNNRVTLVQACSWRGIGSLLQKKLFLNFLFNSESQSNRKKIRKMRRYLSWCDGDDDQQSGKGRGWWMEALGRLVLAGSRQPPGRTILCRASRGRVWYVQSIWAEYRASGQMAGTGGKAAAPPGRWASTPPPSPNS